MRTRGRLLISLGLIALAALPAMECQEEVLATTSLGPITVADLQGHIRVTGIPGDEFATEVANTHVVRLLEWEARDQIALHAIGQYGWGEDDGLQARMIAYWENQCLRLGEPLLVPRRVPTEEEVRAHLEAHAGEYALPDLVSWRHMRFETDANAASAEREHARERAQEALEALSGGEDFVSVAERLATPPAEISPGATIGPMALLEDRMLPEIAQALRGLPLGTPSQPLETPVGLVIIEVLERETGRMPPPDRLLQMARERMMREDQGRRREALLDELRSQHPVEIPPSISPDMPGDTLALRVGEITVTLDDLRVRAANRVDPHAAFLASLSPEARRDLAEMLLIVQETQRRELLTPAQMDLMTWTARGHRAVYGYDKLYEMRQPNPTATDLDAFWEENHDRYVTELVTYEALLIPRDSLTTLASSEAGLLQTRAVESLRARVVSGESMAALQRSLPISSELIEQVDVPLGRVPAPLAGVIPALEPGEVSPATIRWEGAVILRLRDRRQAAPPRETLEQRLTEDWREENGISRREFLPLLLEEHDFEILVDPNRLTWGEGEDVILLPEEN